MTSTGCGVASVRANGTGYSCVDPFGRDPAVSPDNRWIVSVRGEDPVEVYVSDAGGKGARRLTHSPGGYPHSLAPSFSPDGRRILWSKFGGGADGLHVMNVDGNDQRRLTDGGQDPVFSPSGAEIAYTRGGIAVVGADGEGSRLIATDQNGIRRSPPGRYFERNAEASWSPDGRQLAFSRASEDTSFECTPLPDCIQPVRADELYVMDTDGGGVRQLTSTPNVEELDPSWSPDGRRIAYYRRPAREDDAGEIWVMNADGTGQRRVALGANPEWSSLRGGAGRPHLRFRFQRTNRHRRCLGPYDGWGASVKTRAPGFIGLRFSFYLNGRLYDQINNARGLGAGVDALIRRGRTYRLRVVLETPAVNDRVSRTYTFRRC